MASHFTRSSPSTIQPSRHSPVDPLHPRSPPMDGKEIYHGIDPDEQIRPSKRVKSWVSMNPSHSGSTPSSPPNMEPSQPSPLDSVNPSPSMDARKIYNNITSVEQLKPSKRFKSMNPGHDGSNPSLCPTMEPFQPSPVDSVHPSPPTNAIVSITEMHDLDPVEQIDPLISFIENQLKEMKTLSETGSSFPNRWLEIVRNGTKLGAKTIDSICSEAEKLSNSDAMKAMRKVILKVLEEVEDLHWAFIGLSIAAYAVEKYLSVGSTQKTESREVLLNILELAKDVSEHSKRMSYVREKLRTAVCTIVEGAIIFCDSLGTIFRPQMKQDSNTARVDLQRQQFNYTQQRE